MKPKLNETPSKHCSVIAGILAQQKRGTAMPIVSFGTCVKAVFVGNTLNRVGLNLSANLIVDGFDNSPTKNSPRQVEIKCILLLRCLCSLKPLRSDNVSFVWRYARKATDWVMYAF